MHPNAKASKPIIISRLSPFLVPLLCAQLGTSMCTSNELITNFAKCQLERMSVVKTFERNPIKFSVQPTIAGIRKCTVIFIRCMSASVITDLTQSENTYSVVLNVFEFRQLLSGSIPSIKRSCVRRNTEIRCIFHFRVLHTKSTH